jgi:hypothetical protein
MKIAEMTTAEQQLELLRMIMSCTWSNFAQQAEREKAQLKKAKPIATTKGGVKNFSSPPKLPQPKPLQTSQSQLSSPQTANVARMVDVDADANYPPQQ